MLPGVMESMERMIGRYGPGFVLSEGMLARVHRASRTPVRDALTRLLEEGYVERVPRRMLGRVNALGDSLAWAGIPLGGLLAGAAVTTAGLVPVLLTCGAAYFLTTNLAGLRPEWREIDRTRRRGR